MKTTLKILFAAVIIVGVGVSCFVKINTGLYHAESPVARWRFAIYTGECDNETGCHFIKMNNTGPLEYFGLREIPLAEHNTEK